MTKHWYPDHPRYPFNTEQLHEILASGDRVEMMRFFREFQEYANFKSGAPLHWQRFVAKILVMAAENPGDEILELGLSKKTVTKHRDELIARYIYRLRFEDEKRRGEKDFTGSLDAALCEAAEKLEMKKGTLSRIYSEQDHSIKRKAERDADGELALPNDLGHVWLGLEPAKTRK